MLLGPMVILACRPAAGIARARPRRYSVPYCLSLSLSRLVGFSTFCASGRRREGRFGPSRASFPVTRARNHRVQVYRPSQMMIRRRANRCLETIQTRTTRNGRMPPIQPWISQPMILKIKALPLQPLLLPPVLAPRQRNDGPEWPNPLGNCGEAYQAAGVCPRRPVHSRKTLPQTRMCSHLVHPRWFPPLISLSPILREEQVSRVAQLLQVASSRLPKLVRPVQRRANTSLPMAVVAVSTPFRRIMALPLVILVMHPSMCPSAHLMTALALIV
mmetsp:Transcript_22733/g.47188  ORF Transcript_22733/g.47188 Transcript_22733/m.47188 type:complete len:273 (+) Transcript_22733:1274-2092(+)